MRVQTLFHRGACARPVGYSPAAVYRTSFSPLFLSLFQLNLALHLAIQWLRPKALLTNYPPGSAQFPARPSSYAIAGLSFGVVLFAYVYLLMLYGANISLYYLQA